MGKIYNSFAFGLPVGVKVAGQQPLDIRTVVDSISALTDDATWRDGTAILSYKGMIVAVNDDINGINEVYLCLTDYYPSNLETDWKKISTPDLDISGRMVTVIEYNGNKWAKEDGSGDPWTPNEGTEPLPQSDNLEVDTTYLQLALNDDDYVYIKSSDIISLDDYYTKEQVDDKLIKLDSSLQKYVDDEIEDVNDRITDLSTDIYNYVNNEIKDVNDRITDLSTDIYNYVGEQINIVNSSIINVSNRIKHNEEQIADISTSLNEYINILDDYIADTSIKFENIDTSLNKHDKDIKELNTNIADLGDQIQNLEDHIDASIEELKSVDVSLNNKIEDVSLRLAELEIGTVDSISTDTPEYLLIDTSKGDVTINIDASTSTDSENFPNTALATNGYVEEKMAWVEVS